VTLLPLVSRMPSPVKVMVMPEMSVVMPGPHWRPPPLKVRAPVPKLLVVVKLSSPWLRKVPPE